MRVGERTQVDIGPVPAVVALEWCANSSKIVAAAARHRHQVSVYLRRPILELIETLLVLWSDAARDASVFQWSSAVDTDQLVAILKEWQALASLTPADLELLGCSWAPSHTGPMFDAVHAALVDALASVPETATVASDLAARPPGRATPER
ncbi:MAG: hypothetical protein JWN67_3445 [Actinomycetia bacterium]|nr:hypothetical protein [Actinomycetes bacterium]